MNVNNSKHLQTKNALLTGNRSHTPTRIRMHIANIMSSAVTITNHANHIPPASFTDATDAPHIIIIMSSTYTIKYECGHLF